MTTLTDSATVLRRQLLHIRRYPSLTAILIALPVTLLLLFVYVFGATLGAGLPGGGDRAAYVDYVVPGILLLGTGIGGSALLAPAWCAVISLASYLWAKRLFNRRTAR